jgi:hypothetical protein
MTFDSKETYGVGLQGLLKKHAQTHVYYIIIHNMFIQIYCNILEHIYKYIGI